MRIIQKSTILLGLTLAAVWAIPVWSQTDSTPHPKIPLTVRISAQTGYLSAGSCAPLAVRMGAVYTLHSTQIGLEASASLVDLYDKDYPRHGEGVKDRGGLYFFGGAPSVHPSATALGLSLVIVQQVANTPFWVETYGGLHIDHITEYDRHRSSGLISFGDTYTERYRYAWGQAAGASIGYDIWKLPNFRCAPYAGVGWMRVTRYVPFTTSIIGLKAAFVVP